MSFLVFSKAKYRCPLILPSADHEVPRLKTGQSKLVLARFNPRSHKAGCQLQHSLAQIPARLLTRSVRCRQQKTAARRKCERVHQELQVHTHSIYIYIYVCVCVEACLHIHTQSKSVQAFQTYSIVLSGYTIAAAGAMPNLTCNMHHQSSALGQCWGPCSCHRSRLDKTIVVPFLGLRCPCKVCNLSSGYTGVTSFLEPPRCRVELHGEILDTMSLSHRSEDR